jgi:CDP-paratose 2-epimerase
MAASMKLLVTGACGFVGSTIVKELRARQPDVEIIGLDNFVREGSRGNIEPLRRLGVHVTEGDIRHVADLERLPRCDWVLDCAAEPSVLAGVSGSVSSFDVMDHNLIGTLRMLEYCKQHAAGFILMSTSRVYSIAPLASLPVTVVNGAYLPQKFQPEIGLTPAGIDERFPTAPPLSLYGTSKRCSEQIALEYADAFGFPVWINRCGVLAGAGQFGKPDQGIFTFWIRSWQAGRPLSYIGFDGQGSQVRDCLHPRDLLPVLVRQMAGEAPEPPRDGLDHRVCNFSGGIHSAMSLAQVSDWCRDRMGPRDVASVMQPRPFDLPWVVLNSGRAARMWGWTPTTGVEAILVEICSEKS